VDSPTVATTAAAPGAAFVALLAAMLGGDFLKPTLKAMAEPIGRVWQPFWLISAMRWLGR